MGDALVLAGGGTKGAFEVGALLYLTRDNGFDPEIIAGTSAGAIIAGTLAQGRTGRDFHQLAKVVQANVLAVSDIDSVFGRQPWLQEIDSTPFAEIIEQVLSQRSRPELPPESGAESSIPEPESDSALRHRLAALRERRANRRQTPRRHRTLITMSAALSNAPAMVRAGRSFLSEHRALMTLDPLEASLRGERDAGISPIDQERVAASGKVLRLVSTALADGVPRYVTEHGEMVERDSRTVRTEAGHPGVIEGILASAAVPGLFPPRPIGDDVYTDGGVVMNVPVEAAVGAGAGDITALLASPVGRARDETDYSDASLLTVYARSLVGIAVAEQQRMCLHYPRAQGSRLRVIAPTVDVVGAFEVEPGLIMIDFGYGWLRAAEVDAGFTDLPTWEETASEDAQVLRGLSDTIATERERAWVLEEEILRTGPRPALESALVEARTAVVTSVEQWSTFGLPRVQGMWSWGTEWETHRQPVPAEFHRIGLPD